MISMVNTCTISKSHIINLALILLLAPVFTSGAVYVKYDGVDGEARDSTTESATNLRVQAVPINSSVTGSVSGQVVDGVMSNPQPDPPSAGTKLNPQPDPPSTSGKADENSSIWMRVSQPQTGSDSGASVKLNPQPDPPSAPGTEIEDIGAPDAQATHDYVFQRNQTDLEFIKELSAPGSALRAIYVKFDDIKGESQDSAGGGGTNELRLDDTAGTVGSNQSIQVGANQTETADGSEEQFFTVELTGGWSARGGDGDIIITGGYSGKARKPKEIVVVGSKVRGWDPKTKEEIVGLAPTDSSGVRNLDDLSLFTARSITQDDNIEDVTMTENSVTVEYDQPGRLLGFIPAQLTAETTVTFGDGEQGARVKVKFPWYSFLYRKSISISELETVILPEIDDEVLVGFENGDPAVHARAFQAISNIMKAKHDTAMNLIRNLK
jgi:hypothetical protein